MRLSFEYRLLASVLGIALFAAGCGDDDAGSSGSKPDASTGKSDAGVTAEPAVWSMMGNDTTNNYHQKSETKLKPNNAKDLTERWRFTVDGFSTGSASVAEGKVFVLATGGLYALELDSGELAWNEPSITGTASTAYGGGYLYVHAAAGANLYKLKASDGSIVWGPVATYPDNPACDGTSSPIIAGDKVLVGHSCGGAEVTGGDAQLAARGGVEAFDLKTGDRAWTYWTVPEEGENGAMVWSSVAVDLAAKVVFASTGNNYNYAGGGSDAIHAIDLDSGERKWLTQVRADDLWSLGSKVMIDVTGEDTDFGANPILAEAGGRSLVAAGDKGAAFWALDRETGEIVWSRDQLSARHAPNVGGMLNNGAFDGKYFYVASNQPPAGDETVDSLLHKLDAKDGSDAFEPIHLGATVWGALSLANGLLFVPVNTVLQIYDAESGELLNMFETGGTIAAGAPAIVDGKVIVKSGLEYPFAQDAVSNNQVICYSLDAGPVKPSDAGTATETGAANFAGVYKDVIMAAGCAGTALCHAGEAGHLQMKDLDGTYDALVSVKAMGVDMTGTTSNCVDSDVLRVAPGKPDDSLLVQKLEQTQTCGDPMPPGRKLSDAQIQQVRRWISDGAKKD